MSDELSWEEARRRALQFVRENFLAETKNEPALIEDQTIEMPWGWVVFWNTLLYTETGDLEHAVIGPEPICVDRRKGTVASVLSDKPLNREIRRFERRSGIRPWWKLWS